MIQRIFAWIAAHRRWRRDHEAAWHDAAIAGEDLSAFQRACEHELNAALARLGHTVSERRISADAPGERMIHVRISGAPVEVWIYADGAEVTGPGADHRFERWDWRTPAELQAALVERVERVLRAAHSHPA